MDNARFSEFLEKADQDQRAKKFAVVDTLFEHRLVPLVHRDLKDEPTLALASCFQVADGGGDRSNVFVYFDGKELHIADDDAFLNGNCAEPDVLMNTALKNSKLPADQHEAARAEMVELAGMTNPNPKSFFWKAYEAGQLLPRMNALLNDKGATLWNDMESTWDSRFAQQTQARSGEISLARLAFRNPVLYEGERGVGKTFEAREFARTNQYPLVELAGHESVESIDLLGYYTPDGKGGQVWMDGKLSEAFRKAANGEKCVLLIDELLRIPQRQLSVLLTALTPDTDGCYALSTARITGVKDGVGSNEVIRAPVKNICVVGTTNAGQGYAVDEIDPALAERFIPIRKESSIDQIRAILTKEAAKNEVPDAAEPLVKFFEKSKQLYDAGQLEREPSMRTLVRAIHLADPGQVDDVKELLKSQALLWAARDSNAVPVKEQVDAIHKLADSCFAAGRGKVRGQGGR